ncbi:hypothetical protein G6F35_018794 [Rhizopus arrhizus]|nr:hypothetical protein G6F35_018794 [Rhizopus arrhizus]
MRVVQRHRMRDVAVGVHLLFQRAGRFDVPAQHALVLVVARRQPQRLNAVGDRRGVAVMGDVGDELFHCCLRVMPTAGPGSPG